MALTVDQFDQERIRKQLLAYLKDAAYCDQDVMKRLLQAEAG